MMTTPPRRLGGEVVEVVVVVVAVVGIGISARMCAGAACTGRGTGVGRDSCEAIVLAVATPAVACKEVGCAVAAVAAVAVRNRGAVVAGVRCSPRRHRSCGSSKSTRTVLGSASVLVVYLSQSQSPSLLLSLSLLPLLLTPFRWL